MKRKWFSGYAAGKDLLKLELRQRKEEGFLVPDPLWHAVQEKADPAPYEWFRDMYGQIDGLEKNPAFPFEEPDDLDGIRAARPAKRMAKTALPYGKEELRNRYRGAWLGRCAGCALGKPVEGWDHTKIRTYLENRGDRPLRDYFSAQDAGDGISVSCPLSTRERIAFMESDDDIRYTLLGLLLFEKYGKNFSSRDVAFLWRSVLTPAQVCTAEHQALLNFCLFCVHGDSFDPGFTSTFNNPYREWIGAQIRADFFGFMAPGDPETAAEYAWRDACWTHRKNGIYGEMFIAAVEAAAFVSSDPEELVNAGLGEIPENCRLAHEIREALNVIPDHPDMDGFMEYADKRFAGMSGVHTINNAVLCAAALFYGRMDPDRSICEAVTGGLDTDCNGATVGAVTGIAAGAENFGGVLAPKLNNRIRSGMPPFHDIEITALADRTLAVFEKISDEA